ncbi:MAG: hypothetical protein IJR48_02055 [Oscillibacter sp.]|nr:hypothetical protein [Oscillibacter sp.]MBQ7681758.1 hypothetical protein [Oscillibacter sp.]MBQ9617123.1 hypothetical protein [Oscillibacter sp.]
MTVRYTLKRGQPLTPAQIAELDALKDRPIVFDEDCPETTEEQLRQFRRVNPRPDSAEAARKFG